MKHADGQAHSFSALCARSAVTDDVKSSQSLIAVS